MATAMADTRVVSKTANAVLKPKRLLTDMIYSLVACSMSLLPCHLSRTARWFVSEHDFNHAVRDREALGIRPWFGCLGPSRLKNQRDTATKRESVSQRTARVKSNP